MRLAGAGARAVVASFSLTFSSLRIGHLPVAVGNGSWQSGRLANQPRIGYAKIKAIACPISTSPG